MSLKMAWDECLPNSPESEGGTVACWLLAQAWSPVSVPQPQLLHIVAPWLWTRYFTYVCSSFLIYKIGMIVIVLSKCYKA